MIIVIGGCSVKKYGKWIALLLAVLLLVLCVGALAEEISTTVVMRVSRMTQSAVVNVGEDLSLEVNIDGVEPSVYSWSFQGEAIPGATQSIYNLVNAQVENSGIYHLDAYGDDSRLLVSMDINVRVIEDTIPKSGDMSLPVSVAVAAFALAAGVFVVTLRRRVAD